MTEHRVHGPRLRGLVGALALAVCLLALPGPASAETAERLDIYFTGNTLGEYGPCNTCGMYGLGGLSRRAHVFDQRRAERGGADDALFLAGGYEFTPFRTAPGKAALARALAEAYTVLDYDLGVLAAKDAAWFRESDAAVPPGWRAAGDGPQTVTLERAGVRIGIVVFPVTPEPYGLPGAGALRAVLDAAAALRPDVDLLAGLSAWGARGEQALLAEADGLFDILLGSGPGRGFGLRREDGGVLWVRPEFEGVSVLHLTLPLRGDAAEDSVSVDRDAAGLSRIVLDDDIPFDADMTNIFAWF